MSFFMNFEDKYTKQLSKQVAKSTESAILEQLDELVSRNLLVIEQQQPVLVRSSNSGTMEVQSSVRVLLKDQEYIEKLEKENKELQEKLSKVESVLKDLTL